MPLQQPESLLTELLESWPPGQIALLRYFRDELAGRKPLLDGHDLWRLGIPAGPIYKKILDHLWAQQLDGHLSTRPEAEEAALMLHLEDTRLAPL